MTPFASRLSRTLCGLSSFFLVLTDFSAQAQDPKAIAAQLSEKILDGASFVKLRMEINNPTAGGKVSLNLWMKSRRTAAASEIIYQVIFPKERKGEAFLLRKSGGAATGSIIVPPKPPTSLTNANLREGVFGSDLSYEDIIDNFFAWDSQALIGTENVGRTECLILESKPGSGSSSYNSVRSWIDMKKLVPMRIEKYSGSRLAVRIDTRDTHKDDGGKWVTKGLAITRSGSGSSTLIEGTEIKHGVNYADADFTPEGMQKLVIPTSK